MNVDEWGLIRDIHQVSPSTVMTARQVWGNSDHTPQGNPIAAARQDFNDRIAIYAGPAQGAHYYQFQNEWFPKGNVQYFVDYYGELTRLCKIAGLHNTLFDFYPGTPEQYHWAALIPCVRECWPWAIPNYHGYSPFNSDDMSFEDAYWSLRVLEDQQNPDLWPADLRSAKWIIGETSNAGGYENGITLSKMQQLHGLYGPYRQNVLYAAWYIIVNPALPTTWAKFNYSDELPQITDWLLTVKG